MKQKIAKFYSDNETSVDLSFFLAGVIFDVFTLGALDDPWVILQQLAYLGLVGMLLFFNFLGERNLWNPPHRLKGAWEYRDLAIHFLMGSLLSLYSLFFLKSASFFASFVFLISMAILMIANELKSVQARGLDLKLGLYFVCVFSFISMMSPLAFGFVGVLPFLTAWLIFLLFLYGVFQLLRRRVPEISTLRKSVLIPGGSVAAVFMVFYLVGWIPPVPLSVQHLGIYHNIEKREGNYLLTHENPWWRFWRTGDQDFTAAPGDQIFVFARIFSPARISDSVTLHWQHRNERQGWITTDKIPMRIVGGRKEGFRGFASKKNYESGDWRIMIETTDGREIGRLRFWVTSVATPPPSRLFETEFQ